jgi:hypothetical protein
MWQIQAMHFGASYKYLEDGWHLWLTKFERLLRHLFWYRARVHLRAELYGEYTYTWQCTETALEHLKADPPLPVTEWHFTGGPRSFNE